MNGYEKKNAYGSAATAYDYNTEERASTRSRSAYAEEYTKDYMRERESRPARNEGSGSRGFADDLYYGGGARDLYNEIEETRAQSPAPAMSAREEVKIEPSYEETREEDEDLMPSATTMQFMNRRGEAYEDYRAEGERVASRKFKINAKAKVLIAVYALVVLTIFALIILNTTLLKSLDKTVAAKQMQIQQLTEENEMLARTLEDVSSDETIAEKAEEMGMVKR